MIILQSCLSYVTLYDVRRASKIALRRRSKQLILARKESVRPHGAHLLNNCFGPKHIIQIIDTFLFCQSSVFGLSKDIPVYVGSSIEVKIFSFDPPFHYKTIIFTLNFHMHYCRVYWIVQAFTQKIVQSSFVVTKIVVSSLLCSKKYLSWNWYSIFSLFTIIPSQSNLTKFLFDTGCGILFIQIGIHVIVIHSCLTCSTTSVSIGNK